MAVLGIVTCEILECEFAHLLAGDKDISRITIIENANSTYLIERLKMMHIQHLYCIAHPKGFHAEPGSRLEVLVRVLEMGLHRHKRVLRRALRRAVNELAPHVDAFLLGYGLCGNALEHPKELLDTSKPVFLAMDQNHPVDDCVALSLGGRDRYYDEQRRVPGTFFVTAGWSRHWKKFFTKKHRRPDRKMLKRLFANYERSLFVVTDVVPEKEMRRAFEELNDTLGLRSETCRGNLDLLTRVWNTAKESITRKIQES